ncbi:hypothetical protein ACFL3I_03580 [Pseudomonadota bacterium]
MFVEVKQSNHAATRLHHLAEIMRIHRAGEGADYPVLDWLQTNPMSGPALIFDIGRIEQRMQWLKQIAGPLSIGTMLSVKSCADPQYLDAGNKYLDGFDISNPAEYASLPDNLEGKLVSIASPDLSFDLSSFVTKGNDAVFVLDSQAQLDRYFSQDTHIPYLLRVQGASLLSDTDPAYYEKTRFGFTIEEVKHAFKQAQVLANPPSGFHVHHGSERNAESTYRSMISGLETLARQMSFDPAFINLGGGLHGMNREEIGSVLTLARKAFTAPCSILVEPGRWYGNNSGYAIGTIVNQKTAGDTMEYVVNLSRGCHLKWSAVKLIYPMGFNPKKFQEVQFFGSSCYEGDSIGRFLLPYEDDFIQESGFLPGRQVVFSGVNPYSAAWNTSFNGIPKAREVWWRE